MAFLVEQGIKVLCLDIDGTLYPKRMLNARMIRSSFPSLRLAMAFNWARAEYRRVQEGKPTEPENREGLLKRQAVLVAGRMGRSITEQEILRTQKAVDKQFYQAWARSFRSIKAYAGMREALVEAKRLGLSIAVFSDFPLAEKLQTLGIADLVDLAISSEESGYLKPSAKAFAFLLERLNVRADEILYMGDSYSKDCQGSKKAGMHSCLITSSRKRIYDDADLVVSSWKEFASLVL
jgi:putative hydrolase of the HAD superfamily